MSLSHIAGTACVLLFALSCATPPSSNGPPPGIVEAADEALADYELRASVTTRADAYRVTGDDDQSPYPYEGFQPYGEFDVGFRNEAEPYRIWRGQVSGVVSASEYRTENSGLTVERWNLLHERGDAAVPFRAEIGDIYGYFSYRTLQRALKGAQIEFQPDLGTGDMAHSIVLLAGSAYPSWRDAELTEDYTLGASWLVQDPELGRLALSGASNSRDSDPDAGTPDRDQTVVSIAGEKEFEIGEHRITVESELSRFGGDYDGDGTPGSGRDKSDLGIFGQLSGRDPSGISYRARFEDYGESYRPAGAYVPADRRSEELHLGWQAEGGFAVRGRFQRFLDGYESDNPNDTRTYGAGFDGIPMGWMLAGMNARVDGFLTDASDRDGATDRRDLNTTLDLNAPLGDDWQARAGVFYLDSDDRTPTDSDSDTVELRLQADYSFDLGGFSMVGTPGLVVRRTRSTGGRSTNLDPTLALSASRGPHHLDYYLGYSRFNRSGEGGIDVATFSHDLNYRYSEGRDSFGVQFAAWSRDPRGGRDTNAFQFGVFWTHQFEKPARAGSALPSEGPSEPAGSRPVEGASALTAVPPGTARAQARAWLAAAGSGPVQELKNVLVVDARVLPEIDERQRLATVIQAGRVSRSALVIDLLVTSGPEDLLRTFEKVREVLLDRYGRPPRFLTRGEIGPDLPEELRRGDFARVAEWDVGGAALRLGIPRRADGQIRIEIQYGRGLPPIEEPRWSIEAVR